MKLIEINTGDYVCAALRGKVIYGQILQAPGSKDTYYFLQNVEYGGCPDPHSLSESEKSLYKKYQGSWHFSKYSDGYTSKYNAGVNIICKASTKEECEEQMSSMKFQYKIERQGSEIRFTNFVDSSRLFVQREHPDCCGCTILYGFCSSENQEYSRYKAVEDSHIEEILELLSGDRSAKMVHLANTQVPAHEFVKRLGFVPLHTYRNVKSGNDVTIYHLKPIIQNTESKVSSPISVGEMTMPVHPSIAFNTTTNTESLQTGEPGMVFSSTDLRETLNRLYDSSSRRSAIVSKPVLKKKAKAKKKPKAIETTSVIPSYYKKGIKKF